MNKIASKIVYFCVGIWDFGKEKLGPSITKIIERGEKSKQNDSGIIKEVAEGEEAFFNRIKGFVQKIIKEMGLARIADLGALESRVAALEEASKGRQDNDNFLDK